MTHRLVVFISWKDQRNDLIFLDNKIPLLGFSYGDFHEFSPRYDNITSTFDKSVKDVYVYAKWLPNVMNRHPHLSGLIGVTEFEPAILKTKKGDIKGVISVMDSHDSAFCDSLIVKCLQQLLPEGAELRASLLEGWTDDTKYEVKYTAEKERYIEIYQWKEVPPYWKERLSNMTIENFSIITNPLVNSRAVIVLDRSGDDHKLIAYPTNVVECINIINI